MQRNIFVVVIAMFLIGGISVAETENEIKVTAKTEAVALFKNGYTVVRQEIDVPDSGVYCWDAVPAVIHGTFFIESDMNVEVRTTQRLVAVPVDANHPPRLAAGQLVTVRMATSTGEQTITGRIVDTTPTAEPNSLLPELTRFVAGPRYDPFSSFNPYPVVNVPTSTTSIVLESTDGKHHFLTGRDMITSIETLEPIKELKIRRPVMVFNATKQEGGGGGGKIRLFYLTN